ncbi:Putative SOS response-associated peptidase YedK [Loktanella sp. DSM 29012]|uniref:SOS response-associated peptidase n=1 Tax=Loktanella sp. DSM 29012 TaxID=1881056 RepID=UPI0008D2B79B|nr:SOS response-associated peptidase [Loktanella sp. DSM 29012]SEP97294.1 Putative SOS response-associated peptidase YedK [Loktanella sp. DSM 29012]
MCGRMAITLPQEAMIQVFDAVASNDLPPVPNYNVCPTVDVHTVTSDAGRRRLRPMRWGFIPHWYDKPGGGPLLIYARSETIADKPAFRQAARVRRCLIVASGFYEWQREDGAKPRPWYITRSDGGPMVFAGVWQDWDRGDTQLTTCAVVTCAANDAMAPIHHRLPVILSPADWPLWLGEAGHGAATLMKPFADDALRFTRVGMAVNSNRATGPDLMLPVDQ